MAKKTFRINGRVINKQTRQGIDALRVEAWDKDLIFEDLVGSAVTNDDGVFQIVVDQSYFKKIFLDRRPDLFFKVFRGDTLIRSTEDAVLWNSRQNETSIVIEVEVSDKRDLDEPSFRVFGTVRNELGELLSDATVQAFDRDLRREQVLGSVKARAGRYEIRYTRSRFAKAEKGSADLVMKVLGPDGNELYKTPVQFNAPRELELDIALKGVPYKGASAWEVLTAALTPLLDGVSPLELQELREGDLQDISFLAGETGHSHLIVGTWIACFRLADKTAREKTALAPEVFFGFLRQGQPSIPYETLLDAMQHADRMVLLEDKTLRRLTDIIPDLQRSLLEGAVADNLVPPRIGTTIDDILKTLDRIKLRYAADLSFGGGKGTIGQLLDLTPAATEHQAAFLEAFQAHTGPLTTFWQKLEDDKIFPPEVAQQVRLSFELGALTRNHIPLVGELVNRFKSGALKAKRELAKFDRADWVAVFERPGPDGKPVGVPTNIDGDTEQARMQQFAVILGGQFERAYPTTSFSAKLARAESSPVKARQDVVRFLDNNPDFQLDRFRVEHYIAQHDGALRGIRNNKALVSDLKSIQRIFKLNRTYKAVEALLARKIDSAQRIYFMGRSRFLKALSDTGINKIEARKMYRKAENAYALAVATYSEYNIAMNGAIPYAVAQPVADTATVAKIRALPNLQTLFGSLDYCECTECRSVYSPAAYFTDVLRFLDDRESEKPKLGGGLCSVKDILFERRPDLGEIELSCENTNTPLPYIDLVNEILEDVVAPPTPFLLEGAIEPDLVAGLIRPAVLAELAAKSVAVGADAQVYAPDSRGQWAVRDAEHAYKLSTAGAALHLLPTRQTFLAKAELRANPEYTNPTAYTKLQGEVFPLNLPFDLPLTQARAYLRHLGVPLPRLLELFQQQSDDVTLVPSDVQIDCAWLDIGKTERQILTGPLEGKEPWDFWGLAELNNDIPSPVTPADPATNVTGGWIDVLSHVDVMLNRSALTYKELLQLLDMKFVNPDRAIFIFDTADPDAASCDTSLFIIRNLTEAALTRMHQFIRLWRKLGCPMWELDILLPGVLTDAALQALSRKKRLREQMALDWRDVHSLYSGIDHNVYQDRAQDGAPSVQTPYQRLFRNKLVDAVASFPAHPNQINGPIASQVPGILAAFRMKESDLALILADLGLVPSNNLNATKLGHIHRITVLAKALALTTEQFLRLKRLWAQDPFANPAATRTFVELAQQVAASGFSVEQLDYLLAHQFSANAGVALEDKAIVTFITTLREGLLKIDGDVRRKSEETDSAYVKSKLGQLPALAKDADQTVALSIIDGTFLGAPGARNTLIDTTFNGVLDTALAKVTLVALADGLSPADRQAEVDARFTFVQPQLQTFLLKTQQEAFIRQKVAELLQLDTPSASALLDTLSVPGSAVTILAALNDVRLLARQADGTPVPPDEDTFPDSYPDIYRSLRLLHKDALVISTLRIKADELTWWLEGTHAADMGWMHPGDFPISIAAPLAIEKWVSLQHFFTWKGGLPTSDLTAFEFAARALDIAQTSTDNLTDLARLTAGEVSDLNAMAEAFHWRHVGPPDPPAAFDNVKQQLRQSASLKRLADCVRALRRLGINAERAINWATATPDGSVADSIKQTVKAKYDLPQWQQIIRPLQDDFRERKREALVGWLVAHPDRAKGHNWSDTNGLYGHFLIDVEMSACMLTSRLKQAAASIQLFVQRCLLNVEQDVLANAELDKWKQWKWMKQYRVWEANRKVFLYPENWLEPEQRDEKSPFFKDLESELMQNDVTAVTAEDAYLNYLEKLDKVANLEIRTLYNETIGDESVLHVVGRSRSSQAPDHYYRKRLNGKRWTAWQKIELDINANHLVAGIHNRRLYLLWPQFLEKADAPTTLNTPAANSTTTIPTPTKYWEIRLYWSELKKGKWTPKVLSDAFIRVDQQWTRGDSPDNVAFRLGTRSSTHVQVRVHTSENPATDAPTSGWLFDKLGKQVTSKPLQLKADFDHLISPDQSRFSNDLILHTTASQYFYYGTVEGGGRTEIAAHQNAVAIPVLRHIARRTTYSVIDSKASALLDEGSFFMWDENHTYLVDYSWPARASSASRASYAKKTSTFRFSIHYHPFVELFTKEINIFGIKGLLNRPIQVEPASIPGSPALFDFASYNPSDNVRKNYRLPDSSASYPVEDVDFTYTGAYAPYNWELFFHVPFYIANKLSTNQRFEEALEWFHYIFDPTNTDTATLNPNTPQQKFWITKPFYETTGADYLSQRIEKIMVAIAKGDDELQEQVGEWRDHPFNPHLIARMRTVAYQKNVLIKYIQTLIAWGDQLFRRDTIEAINEATQLYILAASILGPRPKSIPRQVENPIKTFYQLEQEGIDDFGNVLKEVENLLPAVPASATVGEDAPELSRLDVLYFCIPNNEKLLKLWETVADRLFNIRHCMNIEGVVRQLPLFEPPIDPAMLVRAAAAGLDIGAVLSDVNAPLPLYRFTFMIQRALEICGEVKALGSAMLAALEKRDAEAFAQLRSSHERVMLDQVRIIKNKQVDEALSTKEALDESKKVIEARRDHYTKLIKNDLNIYEIASSFLTGGAIVFEAGGVTLATLGAFTAVIPNAEAGAAGISSPVVTVKFGGTNLGLSARDAADALKGLASIAQMSAGMTSTIGGYERRAEDWDLQKQLAEKELPQINKQITAADIRHGIAKQDLVNQDKQIENAQKEDEYLRSKFTNQELHDWMVNQLSTVYFQSYQLAYDLAKRAERCFRYELGLTDSSYIQFGYWDSLKKGLLSGERLHYDLKRLETAYYEQNRRDYELTKHISLAQLDPIALLKLRQNGECFVDVPETAFDMDYPGHYFRRIKTVGLSIPCVAGPYTTVACTLTLTGNSLRKDSSLPPGGYARIPIPGDDPRFRDEIAAIQSIATSNGQNDHGMFELNFRDERYLPFEGAGAISRWHIKLNKDFPEFDFATLSDVVIHLNYTAREGGESLRAKVVEEFNKKLHDMALAESRKGLYRVFDLKREYSDKWYKFLHPANAADDQELVLEDLPDRLPYFTRPFPTKKVRQIEVVAQMKDGATYKVQLSPLGISPADLLPLSTDPTYKGLHRAIKDLTGSEINLGAWTLKLQLDGAADFKSLPEDAISELFLIINYTIA
ncbi:MAG: neuraminidase-like domain-containing protein [Hyphomicrobiales bacterium]|nr:neuraminidase-like domain-containing protein [Hyphomicrobiales bacterium]